MSFIRKHLKERYVDLDRTHVVLDEETNQATFLCYNLLGQLIGYQKYNPLGTKKNHNIPETSKYFTCISPMHIYSQAWGLETLNYQKGVLFVTEGVFDAIRLHNLNLPAIAVFTNSPPKALQSYLRPLGRKVIGILDNDLNRSGERLGAFCDEFCYTPSPFKDLGEMPPKEVLNFMKFKAYIA